ncbi:Protein cwh43 [Paramarasmius palmivorus]|uniref:Protein cwh43 n=1 Tax=Paramarasmius palmivorus TaxID=297713 RepID=A0AAW0CY69_9AGAR
MTISASRGTIPKHHDHQNLVIHASTIARAHTVLAFTAFTTALLVGVSLHYKKIVKNGVAGYPQEWFPSVSATIGDWYPERNIFQILIALTSGPRFCLVAFQYLLQRSRNSSLPTFVFISGLARTLSCGGWVYITSTDDHDVHDVCMIAYMVLNLPWMVGGVLCTPLEHPSVRRKRFFEWALIIFDVLYDSLSEQEFREAGLEKSERLAQAVLSEDKGLKDETPKPAASLIHQIVSSCQELALLATLSPVFLGISCLRSWASTRAGSTILHLLSLSGLAAYALKSPIHRLFVVTPATAIAMIRQAVDWRKYPLYSSTIIGFLLSSLSKHINHSNNPVWPIVDHRSGGYNKTGLALAFLALFELYTRPLSALPTAEREKSKLTHSSTFAAALPLGSLLFIFHHHLSEPGTLVAWSWTGYENGRPRGPVPNFHGSLTLIAQSLGVLLAVTLLRADRGELLAHPLWFLVGSTGAFVMYQYKDWSGYSGGLVLALFAMSITPLVIVQASRTKGVGRTYFTAMVVYCLISLAAVWTVAYAFVPGGIYLRERTDLVIFAQMACLAPAFKWNWPASQQRALYTTLPASVASSTRTVLAFISVLGVLSTLYRLPSSPPTPYRPGPRILRAGIWTIHFGIDNEGRDSQRRVKDLITGLQLDVVGLLETDLHRPVYGNRDLTRVIAEEGYYVDIGPGPNAHTWGAVLLSKFPIINSTHHLLPSPHGELAPAIEAVLDVFGTPVAVIVSHNGQEEDPLDRELQSRELGRIMASHYPNPTIFLGYVVTKPHVAKHGKMHDIDQADYDRWCEYILYRGLYRTSYARVSRSTITDTELQVGQFILPKHGHTVTNDTYDARYLRIRKESLPQEHWFPMEYYGNERQGGVNGHFYHVFNTPLYYNLPEDAVL